MEYYVVIQEGGYMEEKEIDVVTHEVVRKFHVTNSVSVPVASEFQQWETWRNITEGYDTSPHWDMYANGYSQYGPHYRAFQHRDLRSVVVRVFIETKN